jgi:hypothetical protein
LRTSQFPQGSLPPSAEVPLAQRSTPIANSRSRRGDAVIRVVVGLVQLILIEFLKTRFLLTDCTD